MRAPPLLLLLLPLLLVLPEGPPTSSFSSIPSILITCTPHPSIRPAWFTILGGPMVLTMQRAKGGCEAARGMLLEQLWWAPRA